MASAEEKKSILIVDDEPNNVQFIGDHLNAQGYSVEYTDEIDRAIDTLQSKNYRFLVIDLNIPSSSGEFPKIPGREDIFLKYPGLSVAYFSRNNGYRARQIVMYSIHKIPAVLEVLEGMGCTFIHKGDPISMMMEIRDILSYDPTAEESK